MKVRNLTQGSPLKLILSIALPLMVGNIFQQLYTVVDASVVGKGIGVSALAAVGAADWFNWLFLSAVTGLAQGFTIPMAQSFGAKDYDGLRKNVGCASVLAIVTGFVIAAAALLLVKPVLSLLDTPEDIRPMSAEYLYVLFSGIPVIMVYNLLAGILRALGDAKSPLYAMILASVVNVILDVLFVMGFGWGVGSASAATVIAQMISCVFCLMQLKKIALLRMKREDFRLDGARSLHLMRLGLPIALQNSIIAVGGMIVQRVVNPLGVTFIAGYTATNKLYGVLEMAAISYGYALTAYAGQNLGAGEFERIRKGVRAGLLTGVITALLIALMMFVGGEWIVSLFIDINGAGAAEAIRLAKEYLWLMSAFLPVLYILHVYRSSLQGMGDTVMPMVSGLGEFVMRTGAAILLPGMIGYWGVFWAEVLAWAGADLILIPAYIVRQRRLSSKSGL